MGLKVNLRGKPLSDLRRGEFGKGQRRRQGIPETDAKANRSAIDAEGTMLLCTLSDINAEGRLRGGKVTRNR
jgi:hypothetical protein